MSNLATIVNNILADSGIDDINVVVTTGSYANPAWITSLAWTKITGAPANIVTGVGTTNYLPKFTGASIIGNSQIFDNGTNVGIGTTTPTYKIDLFDSNGNFLQLYQNDGTYNRRLLVTATTIGVNAGISLNATSTTGGDNMMFLTASAERMRITSDGVLLVGTTTSRNSDSLFQVEGGLSTGGQISLSNSYTLTTSSVTYGKLNFVSMVGGSSATVASILATNDGNHTSTTNKPTQLIFFTTPSGTAIEVERMRLSASGNLGLGVTPSAWVDYRVLQLGGGSISSYTDNNFFEVNQNVFWNGVYRYVNNGFASRYQQTSGRHEWYQAPSGTAGNAISFTQAMTLNASGNLGIGTTSPAYKLHVVTDAVAGRQNMSNISRTTGNWVRFTNPQYSADASMGLLLRVFPDSDLRQGAGIIASGGSNNACTNLDLFVTTSPDGLGGTSYSALRIDGFSGNVGIGLTSPGYKLSIQGNAGIEASEEYFYFNSTYVVGNNARGKIRAVGAGGGSGYGGDLRFSSRASNNVWNEDILTIANTGNVGIATASPNYKLEVNGSFASVTSGIFLEYNSGILYHSGGSGNYYQYISGANYLLSNRTATGSLVFSTVDTERMRITSGGLVGIGTTAPTQALHVVGNTYISQRLDVGMSPSPFWNARFRDFSDGSGVFIGSVAAGGYKFISGDSYYENSLNWHSVNTTSAVINLQGGNFAVYTNSGLTPNTNFFPTERFRINTSGVTTIYNLAGTGTRMVVADASGNLSTQAIGSGAITGSGTTNYLPKFTGASTIGNSIITDSGSQVVINTATSTTSQFRIENTSFAAGQTMGIDFTVGGGSKQAYVRAVVNNGTTAATDLVFGTASGGNNAATVLTLASTGAATFSSSIQTGGIIYNTAVGTNSFALNSLGANYGFISNNSANTFSLGYGTTLGTIGTPVLTWNSSGNVGIGTTAPDMLLSVRGSDSTAVSSTTFWNFTFKGAELSNLSNTVNTVTGLALTGGSNRTSISAIANILESASLGALAFFTGGSGVSNTAPERMRITSGGNVGIGTASPTSILDASVSGGATSGFRFKGWSDASTPYLLSLGTQTYQDIFQIKSVNGLVTMGIVGSIGSTPDLAFQTNTTERMRITSGGEVLINATGNTGFKLFVNGNTYSSTLGTGPSGLNVSGYGFLSQTLSGQMTILGHNIIASNSVNNQVNVVNGGWISSMIKQYYNDGITFHTDATMYSAGAVYPMAATERMRITSGGNVGIGTTSPSARLDVVGSAGIRVNEDGSGTKVISIRSDFAGVDPAINVSTNNALLLQTNNTERMRITSAGDLLIGDTTASANLWVKSSASGNTFGARNTNATFAATVGFFGADRNTSNNTFYYIDCYNYGNSTYRFRVADSGNVTSAGSVTATSFFESSDKRLKSNIIDLDVNVSSIIAKSYLKDGVEEIGYIAQDVENILPSAISIRENGYLDLSYRQIHTAKIAALEKEVAELKKQLKNK